MKILTKRLKLLIAVCFSVGLVGCVECEYEVGTDVIVNNRIPGKIVDTSRNQCEVMFDNGHANWYYPDIIRTAD